jgi:hypothetical protein
MSAVIELGDIIVKLRRGAVPRSLAVFQANSWPTVYESVLADPMSVRVVVTMSRL